MRRDESDERGGYLAMEGRTCKKEGMRTEGMGVGGEERDGEGSKTGERKSKKRAWWEKGRACKI